MKIEDLDEYLDKEEPVSGFFILDENEEYQKIVEKNHMNGYVGI